MREEETCKPLAAIIHETVKASTGFEEGLDRLDVDLMQRGVELMPRRGDLDGKGEEDEICEEEEGCCIHYGGSFSGVVAV